MIGADRGRAIVESLAKAEGVVAEVFLKRGRTRRSGLGPQGPVAVVSRERGWAVRAGGAMGSFFACGTGSPGPGASWPEFAGPPLTLPEPVSVPPWSEPSSLDAPLMVEGEALSLIEGIERELIRQLPDARLVGATLDDGSSESLLLSSRGIEEGYRSRLAMLHLEAVRGANAATRTRLDIAAVEAGALAPQSLARRLADCLTARGGPPGPVRERGDMILAPAVGAQILAALGPLWLGREGALLASRLADRSGRLAAASVTVVDDPRRADGGLAAPIDGEGMPTRRVVILDKGRFAGPLLDWRRESRGRSAAGCQRRPSWRDLPRPGFSHLYIQPDPAVSAADLVGSAVRGFYLLDTLGPARVDFESDRIAVPVCGFGLRSGQADATIGRAWLSGSVAALLRGVRGVARDLTFAPLGAMVGAPTLHLSGLELRRELG